MPEVLPVEAEETNAELKALATAYGECIWEWSLIEAELFHVFRAASGLVISMTVRDTERQKTLARAFFAVKGFEIRLAMTHELAKQRWEKSPHLATWNTIYDELRTQKGVRGKIAHCTGLLYPNQDSRKPPIALLIDPRLHVDISVNFQDAKNRGFTLLKLLRTTSDLLRLRKRMAEFVLALVQEQHVAFAQLQADPPLPLRTQDNQTPKEPP